jgi:hypothetical protein
VPTAGPTPRPSGASSRRGPGPGHRNRRRGPRRATFTAVVATVAQDPARARAAAGLAGETATARPTIAPGLTTAPATVGAMTTLEGATGGPWTGTRVQVAAARGPAGAILAPAAALATGARALAGPAPRATPEARAGRAAEVTTAAVREVAKRAAAAPVVATNRSNRLRPWTAAAAAAVQALGRGPSSRPSPGRARRVPAGATRRCPRREPQRLLREGRGDAGRLIPGYLASSQSPPTPMSTSSEGSSW